MIWIIIAAMVGTCLGFMICVMRRKNLLAELYLHQEEIIKERDARVVERRMYKTKIEYLKSQLENVCTHKEIQPYVFGDEPTDELFCPDCGKDFDHDPSYTPTEA